MRVEEAVSIGFEQLSAHYRPLVEHMLRAYYMPDANLDDLRQELDIVIWRCHENVCSGRVSLRHDFDPYLRQSMLNRLIDLFRSAARRPVGQPLEDVGILTDDNSRNALLDAEMMMHLDSVPLSRDARLLVRLVLDDVRDYREMFIRRIGGVGGRARFASAKRELGRAMKPFKKEVLHHAGQNW